MKSKAKAVSVKSAAKGTAKKALASVKKSGSKLAGKRGVAASSKVVSAIKKVIARTSATAASARSKSAAAKPAARSAAVRLGARIDGAVVSAKKSINSAADRASKPVLGLVNALTEAQIRKMSAADYMNDSQLDFFRRRLLQTREEVLAREVDVKERLHQRENFADPADRASAEEEHWLDLRLRERESLLLRKIDDALRRIKEKEYGYCDVTGEAIGIPRLLARPTATVCVDVKGHTEQIESQFRDR